MSEGRLIGVGVGPGDPELLTVKAVRVLQAAPVVAFFAKAGRRGNARKIVEPWLTPANEELQLAYPVTTEIHFADPCYRFALAAFYDESAERIAAHLREGRDVALLSEGDPLFYGSFMHLFMRLKSRYATSIVPGVTGMCGAWAPRQFRWPGATTCSSSRRAPCRSRTSSRDCEMPTASRS